MPDAPQGQTIEPRLLAPGTDAYNAHRAALPAVLRALVHAAMMDAMKQGMLPGEAAETVAFACADLLRSQYGECFLQVMAGAMIARAGQPFEGGK